MEKKKTIIAAVILLLLFIIGGAIAYFTDTDDATNTFTIGNVEIEVVETAWDALTDTDDDGIPDDAEDMMPGETVTKDPKIHNLSNTNSAYVFMKVVSPCTVPGNDEENPKPVREMVTYTAKSGWYLMTPSNSCTNGTLTRIYAYGSSTAMTELTKNDASATTDETPTLFDSITLNPLLDGSEEDLTGNKNVVITGYGIQKEGLTSNAPADVWTAANFS